MNLLRGYVFVSLKDFEKKSAFLSNILIFYDVGQKLSIKLAAETRRNMKAGPIHLQKEKNKNFKINKKTKDI